CQHQAAGARSTQTSRACKVKERAGCKARPEAEEGQRGQAQAGRQRYAVVVVGVSVMILGVKAFTPRLTAVKGKGEYQYKTGKNVTEKAKCANTGFHLCEDPLDCLSYYDWDGENQFWAVAAGGDIDEDGTGTRISCTELTLIRRLTADEFL